LKSKEEFISFYKNKKILITGHTGFKGSWMAMVLLELGAKVAGYALAPEGDENLFDICQLKDKMESHIGDIRDLIHLQQVFHEFQPEIVIHMAAQPIVRESYKRPVYTYETNVMGTVNVLECIRNTDSVKSVINVTTDKVYRNLEKQEGYIETDELNGYDPYSNSKSCSELVTSSYVNSFFKERHIAVSTMRAGNVIGGGDFAKDRIIPDCVRAALKDSDIIIRNPYSVRPFQHVLEPVVAYLYVAMKQYENHLLAGAYNVGPEDKDCWTTGSLADLFCQQWKEMIGKEIHWLNKHDGGPHEAGFLKLDCGKIKETFGWMPKWDMNTNMKKIIEWTKVYMEGAFCDVQECMKNQIWEYLE